MAYIESTGQKDTSIGIKIGGMSAVAYERFAVIICKGGEEKRLNVSKNGGSVTYTFTGLKSGTKYTFIGRIYKTANSGRPIWEDSIPASTTGSSTTKLSPPRLRYNSDITSCEVTWSCPTGAGELSYACWPHGGSAPREKTVNASRESLSLTGLDPNTYYKMKARYITGDSDYSNSDYYFEEDAFKTDDYKAVQSPRLSFKATRTSCEMSWSRPTGAVELVYKCWAHGGGEPSSYTRINSYNGKTTIPNLKVNTIYKIKAKYTGSVDDGYKESGEIFIGSAFTTMSYTNFKWSTTPKKGSKFSITKNDWDNLQDIINERRNYNKKWKYTAEVGKPLTADMWNEVIDTLVNCHVSDIPGRVEPGAPCVANDFIRIQNCTNRIG